MRSADCVNQTAMDGKHPKLRRWLMNRLDVAAGYSTMDDSMMKLADEAIHELCLEREDES